jgi:hypothetical protein
MEKIYRMVKDRIEFAIGDDHGELKSNINDWLSKTQDVRVKKIDFFPASEGNVNKPMCMIWYESTT